MHETADGVTTEAIEIARDEVDAASFALYAPTRPPLRQRANIAITPELKAERLDRLKALLAEGRYNREIQEELGIGRSTLWDLLKSNGLRSNLMPKSIDYITAVVALRKLGKSYTECGRILCKTKGAISGLLTRHGMTKRTPFRGVRLFSPARDAAVREAFQAGEPIGIICAKCNALPGEPVNKRNVSNRANAMKLRRPTDYNKKVMGHQKSAPPAFSAVRSGTGRPGVAGAVLLGASTARTARRTAPAPVIPRRELPDDPPSDDWCPGGARIPVTRAWSDICAIARSEGFLLMNLYDLPAYNKSRIRRDRAPYAIPRNISTNKRRQP